MIGLETNQPMLILRLGTGFKCILLQNGPLGSHATTNLQQVVAIGVKARDQFAQRHGRPAWKAPLVLGQLAHTRPRFLDRRPQDSENAKQLVDF